MGEYLPRLLPMRLREVAPLQISQPDGTVVHARRPAAELAGLAAAAGLQPPGGPGTAQRRVPDGGPAPAGRAPAVLRRDGRAVPGSDAGPLPAHRVRHRRVGTRLPDHVAVAGLRLPGRDHLSGRRRARLARRAGHDPERDLHPRGGRGVLWKHVDERTGAEVRRAAAAGHLLPRDRGQLRVPGVLALLPGRQHRVRGPGHRDHGHLPCRARPPAANRRAGRSAHLRAVPPALHRGQAGPGRGRPGQHRLCLRLQPLPVSEDNPYGLALVSRETALRTEAEGKQDYDWQSQRSWKVVNHDSRAGWAPRSATSWCRGGVPAAH